MQVSLYVYDLSKGLARSYSLPLTGTQIDAIYHTSVVLGGVEYYFGRGIHQSLPGQTHHGQPIEKIPMGKTEIPEEDIIEYLYSLEEIYNAESYDLFLHNCNNFSQDFCMFLTGKSIPEHIRNLPQTFLNTPFGQMMKPHIDGALRGITQAPVPMSEQIAAKKKSAQSNTAAKEPAQPMASQGKVHNVSTLREIESLLFAASKSCAVIFFTSSTCPPCKLVYPAYDELASEAGDKATLIKVDMNVAYDVSSKYDVSATPTFMTFLKGKKENVWSGADEGKLRGNVRLLIQMAWPVHPHARLRLPSLQRKVSKYVTYDKLPPLDKLVEKLGPTKDQDAIKSLITFVKTKNEFGAANAALPDLTAVGEFVKSEFQNIPAEKHFALIDLFRIAFLDARVSDFFAESENQGVIRTLLSRAEDMSNCPYNVRLVMLQLACNLYVSPLYPDRIVAHNELLRTCIKLASSCIQDSHANIRVIAASLAYNLAAFNHNGRSLDSDTPDKLSEDDQVELVAVLLDGIQNEKENVDSLHGFLLALGLLVYGVPVDGLVIDLCKAMGAADFIAEKEKIPELKSEPLLKEVGRELLGKGLVK